MKNAKIFLYPFSLVYRVIVWFRNTMFDAGILRSQKFPIWSISVGNLSVGGTGKSPHIEYLIRLLGSLSSYKNLHITPEHTAILSRGYGRSTSGFILASENSTAQEIGDEPMQMRLKFQDVYVAVDEKRVHGIKKLLEINKDINLILLDDAFQHRYVKPSLSILLTNYYQPFYEDSMMPFGTLREPMGGYRRADIIIVTRTPQTLLDVEKKMIIKKIKPFPHQKVFFSHVVYQDMTPVYDVSLLGKTVTKETTVVLLTGIANANDFRKHLQKSAKEVIHISYPDHHWYSLVEIMKMIDIFNNVSNPDKIIITTEKDAARLHQSTMREQLEKLPVFYTPIQVKVKDEEGFEAEIVRQLGSYQLYNPIQKIK
ncbi:MAG TPA: tetraacyldisaccharide 4'-kinase [Bacteroidia bacterium]|jgi:tetraacyldisaccharide 4'-kinase|nr:tetraacyldisaccharide 4'-kinase [Bacteroidia bacterium]